MKLLQSKLRRLVFDVSEAARRVHARGCKTESHGGISDFIWNSDHRAKETDLQGANTDSRTENACNGWCEFKRNIL